VDQYSGKVLVAQNSRTAPGPTRTRMINRAIHTGDIFGVPSRLIAAVSSLLVLLQMISGVIMWLKREKGKKNIPSTNADLPAGDLRLETIDLLGTLVQSGDLRRLGGLRFLRSLSVPPRLWGEA